MIDKVRENRVVLVPMILATVAGAIVTIAAGFVSVFKVVSWIGN